MHRPTGFRLGIDFGTTHTVATLARPDGRVQPLLFASSPLLLSAVYAEAGRRLLTGRDAQRSARLDASRYEPNVKRRIDDGTILLGTDEYPVGELIAAVLRRVYDEAVRVAGEPPAYTVLTHPAGWAPTRRGILVDAAERAGIGNVSLVPEPLAAAAYFSTTFGRPVPPGSALVVYDFGGGTFDVSVIQRESDGGWRVVANEGIDDVGGVDLDAAIIEHIRARLAPADPVRWQQLVDPSTDGGQRGRWVLRDEAQSAKEQLSRTSTAVVRVPGFETDVHVTREEFEGLARPWLERTVALTAATLFRTGLRKDNLVAVLLVGGSSRIPQVATLLHQRLGIPPTVLDQPELVVAEGSLQTLSDAVAPAVAVPPATAWPAVAVPPPAPVSPAWPAAAVPAVAAPAKDTGGRWWLWTLVAVLAVALLSTTGVVLVKAAHRGSRPRGGNQTAADVPTAQSRPAQSTPASRRSASPTVAAGILVSYDVTASGANNVGSVSYVDQDGQIIHKSGVPLPWHLEFTDKRTHPSLVLITQRKSGGDGGPVTCTITANGKVISTTTISGRNAAPECSGSG